MQDCKLLIIKLGLVCKLQQRLNQLFLLYLWFPTVHCFKLLWVPYEEDFLCVHKPSQASFFDGCGCIFVSWLRNNDIFDMFTSGIMSRYFKRHICLFLVFQMFSFYVTSVMMKLMTFECHVFARKPPDRFLWDYLHIVSPFYTKWDDINIRIYNVTLGQMKWTYHFKMISNVQVGTPL